MKSLYGATRTLYVVRSTAELPFCTPRVDVLFAIMRKLSSVSDLLQYASVSVCTAGEDIRQDVSASHGKCRRVPVTRYPHEVEVI